MRVRGTTPLQRKRRSGGRIPGRRSATPATTLLRLTALLACLFAGAALAPSARAAARSNAAATAKSYVEQFYPLWFTSQQLSLAPHNQLVGPDRISPIYQTVVAINDDTLYCSTPVDVPPNR